MVQNYREWHKKGKRIQTPNWYLDPGILRDLLIQAQAGEFKIELVDAVRLLVRRLGGCEDDEQQVLLDVVRWLHRIDPEQNVFAFITSRALWVVGTRHRREKSYDGMIKRFAWFNGWVPRWGNGRRGKMRFVPASR